MDAAFVRPHRPLEVGPDTLESFPLMELAKQLMRERSFWRSGRDALTLVRNQELTIVLAVAREGTTCGEHSAPAPSSVVVLSGSLTLTPAGEPYGRVIDAGEMATYGQNFVHAVTANEDSTFLIIIGQQ